jgi:hypothetical protein
MRDSNRRTEKINDKSRSGEHRDRRARHVHRVAADDVPGDPKSPQKENAGHDEESREKSGLSCPYVIGWHKRRYADEARQKAHCHA